MTVLIVPVKDSSSCARVRGDVPRACPLPWSSLAVTHGQVWGMALAPTLLSLM